MRKIRRNRVEEKPLDVFIEEALNLIILIGMAFMGAFLIFGVLILIQKLFDFTI